MNFYDIARAQHSTPYVDPYYESLRKAAIERIDWLEKHGIKSEKEYVMKYMELV
jgi:hypothetical protein